MGVRKLAAGDVAATTVLIGAAACASTSDLEATQLALA